MFNLDLKKAEVALKAGRLDEAFRLLDGCRAVEHASGQRLKDQMVSALVERGRQHLADLRYPAARADVGLAKRLGGHQVDVLKLEQEIDAANLSAARGIQDRALAEAVERLEALAAAADYESVVRAYKTLNATLNSNQRSASSIVEILKKSTDALVAAAWEDFKNGRLDRCERSAEMVAGVSHAARRSNVEELIGLLKKVQSARAAIKRADYRDAVDELKRVQLVVSGVVWIDETLKGLVKCMQGVEEIMTGPLGLLETATPIAMTSDRAAANEGRHLNRIGPRRTVAASACGRTILQVDQVGSLLMLAGDHFSIGTTSTSGRPDVVLQTEGQPEALYIRRAGEDYLAASGSPFIVNGKTTRQHLLTNGDSIDVGKRGRLTFTKPVAASNTAVLQIKGSKLDRRAIRSIVLVGDAVLFGDSGSHFRIPGLANRIIVRPVTQDNEPSTENAATMAKRQTEFLIHQKGDSDPRLLRFGAPVVIGNCQFSQCAYSAQFDGVSSTGQSPLSRRRSHS